MQANKEKKMNPEQELVFNHILEGILAGRFPVGERIPTEMELAHQLGAGRMNVHHALTRLEERRLLFRNKRGGTRVAVKPNTFATGELKRETCRRITVLNPLPADAAHIHWNPEITGALAEGLNRQGFELDEVNIRGIRTPAALAEKLRELSCGGAAGLLIISYQNLNVLLMTQAELFFRCHRNIFIYSRDLTEWSDYPYNIVSVDLFNEGVMAAEYACSKNYERFFFGFARKKASRRWLAVRREGIRCGLRRLTGETAAEVLLDGEMKGLLAALDGPARVALIAATDQDAVLFREKIFAATGKLPGRDYGLIGFNRDSSLAQYHLTTIAPPLRELGEALAETIAGVVGRRSNRTSFIKIQSQLIPGESC